MNGMTPQDLGRLIDEHAPTLELYAAQWTSSTSDVVQEAFVELIRVAVMPDRVVPWLFRVVRHRAMNAARSEQRRRRHEQRAARVTDWFEPSSLGLEAAEAVEVLTDLPAEQREVIVARIWGQLSFDQIAELTEMSTSTAFRRYQSGLNALRQKLSEPWLTKDAL